VPHTNALSLPDMSLLHYVALLTALGVTIFMLTTAITCICSNRRMKWLWVPFILIGVGRFGIQWVPDGQYCFQLAIQLLGGFVVTYAPFEPWVVGMSLPLGAIMFWATNHKRTVLPHLPDEGATSRASEPHQPVGIVNVILLLIVSAVTLGVLRESLAPLSKPLCLAAMELMLLMLALQYVRGQNLSVVDAWRLQAAPVWILAYAAVLGLMLNVANVLAVAGMRSLLSYPGKAYPPLLLILDTKMPDSLWSLGSLIFLSTVAVPVCEEILFRGVVLSALVSRGPRKGVLYTAALFMIWHFSGASLWLLALGLLTGILVLRTGSVLPAILCHICYNGMGLIAVVVYDHLGSEKFDTGPAGTLLALAGLAAFLLLSSLVLFLRHTRNVPVCPPSLTSAHEPLTSIGQSNDGSR
jgi:membrane protease YdiL (CAAX protease family)